MADILFPSHWSDGPQGDARLFQNGGEVPAGWVHRPGHYDAQIGQFVDAAPASEPEEPEAPELPAEAPAEPVENEEPAPAPVEAKPKPQRKRKRRAKAK